MTTICLSCNHLNRENARFCGGCGTKLSQSVSDSSTLSNEEYPVQSFTGQLELKTLLAGRYSILKKIGQGGMGAVYLVNDRRLAGKMWALKEMSESNVSNRRQREDIIKDFQREAQLLASLDHANIPKVSDSFNHSGRYYLVMEYVKGSTLRDLLNNRSEPFSEEEVRQLTYQLCDVLSYIHARQPPIIFRDLKPENIMIDEHHQIKLIDFGIARLLKPGQNDTKLLGTRGYAAPEQYTGKTEPRSDIYALGVILHELLTKHDPTSVTPLKALPAVEQLVPSVSKEMALVIRRSLAPEPSQRWQNAAEIKAMMSNSSRQNPSRVEEKSKQNPNRTKTKTSRPTTQLLLVVNKLSTKQLATFFSGLIGVVILAVWQLAPAIRQNYPLIWDNIPTFMIIGPIAYGATGKRWAAMMAHIPLTIVFWLTLWLRLNASIELLPLILSSILSGLLLEAAFYLMSMQILDGEQWRRELAWFSMSTIVSTILFYLCLTLLAEGYASLHYYGYPGIWLAAGILGLLGWFFGDLIQQWLKMRNISI